jgi:hypothetical protein
MMMEKGGGSSQKLNPVHSVCSACKNGKRHIINDGVTWQFVLDAQRAARPGTVEGGRFKYTVISSIP